MAKRGPVCVLACYVLWGILPAFWKLLGAVDSVYILASRIVWSFVLITAVLALKRSFAEVRDVMRRPGELARLAVAGVVICVNWGSFIWAVNNGHVMDSSLAYYMNPILTILLGAVVFRERLAGLQWLSLAITALGIVICVVRYGQIPWLALVIGGSFSIYGAIKKGVKVSSDVALFWETLVTLPVFTAVLIWMEAHGTGAVGTLHGWQFLLLPAAGAVTTIPLVCFSEGIKHTPLSLSGILMYINPTLQLLLSVALYGEAFTTTNAILFVFVWTGLALYLISGWRQRRKGSKEENVCG